MEHTTIVKDLCDLKKDYLNSGAITSIPVIDDRAFWDGLDRRLSEKLIEAGEEEKAGHWNQILFSDYYRFSKDGNREVFEDMYFARRKKLSRLVLAECAENKGRFTEDILNGFYLILQETSWCVPAHNSYIRDTPQLPLPDADRPVIDLFAGESAALLGVCEYILRSRFEKISPFISSGLNSELRKRILIPYLNYHFWWMGNGLESVCNWTPWITQNVLLAVMTRPDGWMSDEEKKAVIDQACVSLDFFLDEYGDDGCCNEGAQYYSHAGLCLYGCLDILDQIFDGTLEELWSNERIGNIADYIAKVYVGDGYYVNFADCSPLAGRRTAREYLFGKRTLNSALMVFAAEDYVSESWDEKLISDEQNLYYHVLQTKCHKEMTELADSHRSDNAIECGKGSKVSVEEQCAGDNNTPIIKLDMNPDMQIPDVWYPSVGLMVARDDTFLLAAKAGNNADSHNHNDVGSVIVYKNSRPVLIDLGVETYSRKTFSSERYDIWTMQSRYHNLPTFGDVMQKDGADFGAEAVECVLGDDKCSLSMEIKKAYPTELIKSYHRTASLIKGGGIEITDTYEGSLPCTLSLITYEEPIIENGTGVIDVGDIAKIEISGVDPSKIRIEELPITDDRLGIAWHHSCYRILIEIDEGIKINIR